MKSKLPIFKSPQDRAKFLVAYDEMFSLWEVPHDAIEIETGFGLTHINASGPESGFPLVLLHGASGLFSGIKSFNKTVFLFW